MNFNHHLSPGWDIRSLRPPGTAPHTNRTPAWPRAPLLTPAAGARDQTMRDVAAPRNTATTVPRLAAERQPSDRPARHQIKVRQSLVNHWLKIAGSAHRRLSSSGRDQSSSVVCASRPTANAWFCLQPRSSPVLAASSSALPWRHPLK